VINSTIHFESPEPLAGSIPSKANGYKAKYRNDLQEKFNKNRIADTYNYVTGSKIIDTLMTY
jgi:hypothetical protein